MHHPPFPDLRSLPPLSDEAAALLLRFLYHCAAQFESHYDQQLRRYYQDPTPDDQLERFPDTDPPF